jgi:hypothetical protein
MAADPAGGSPGMSYRLFLVPGQQGDAAGAAVQFRMLTTAGFDTDTAVGGLTAFSLLEVGGLLALPLSAPPAIVAGVPVRAGYAYLATLAYRIASYWLPCWPGRRLTCCSATATDGRSPAAPRRARPTPPHSRGRPAGIARTSRVGTLCSPGPR